MEGDCVVRMESVEPLATLAPPRPTNVGGTVSRGFILTMLVCEEQCWSAILAVGVLSGWLWRDICERKGKHLDYEERERDRKRQDSSAGRG